MNGRLASAIVLAALAASAPLAAAPRPWLLPSTTTVAAAGEWVPVDAAISDVVFFADRFPLPLEGMTVTAPDGSAGELRNLAAGHTRATFDVALDRPGTWKIATLQTGMTGSFKLNGEEWRVGRRGPPRPPGAGTGAGAARAQPPAGRPMPHIVASPADIPAGATDVRLVETSGRTELFLTAGVPTRTVLKPGGKGLEAEFVGHPDDLVADEPAQLRFLIDGRPAAGVKVTVVPDGRRYRDADDAIELVTGADGMARIAWPHAGMMWLGATAADAHPADPRAGERRMTYATTLEVMAP